MYNVQCSYHRQHGKVAGKNYEVVRLIFCVLIYFVSEPSLLGVHYPLWLKSAFYWVSSSDSDFLSLFSFFLTIFKSTQHHVPQSSAFHFLLW